MSWKEYKFWNQLDLKLPLNSKCGPGPGQVFFFPSIKLCDSNLTKVTNLHLVCLAHDSTQ